MAKLTLDSAGRVVIPKSLRQELRLGPGDTLPVGKHGRRDPVTALAPQSPIEERAGRLGVPR
ncbi:MAG: AbrB/MazE/SpoVT family DNA-binding domain-containing protein [Bryobacterales bacterium]|nr:AbrB/MazE/SpoVT family DNA-binding domain-containing protein [Bryobacterales bacterium]MBV9401810.1 AbrB/MazE/SpoVT family DNA-binding domain-containing protein [Bryobacterales bacterium]